MKLMIGTAQFGREYGIANKVGKVPYDEVLKILELAADNCGTVCVDTSNDYGKSEKILGKAARDLGIKLDITTKLYREFDKECPDEILNGVECMLERLQVPCVDALLIHDSHWLLDNRFSDYVYGMLMVLKGKGYTKKIGVSVGSPEHAIEIINNYRLDVIQAPFNLLDQRLLNPHWLKKLSDVELHVRSVFLQGLLLMDPNTLSEYFDPIKEELLQLRSIADVSGASMLKMCLDFVTSAQFDRVIVGVDSVSQLQDILDARKDTTRIHVPHGSLIDNDPKFINPGLWPVGGWWK